MTHRLGIIGVGQLGTSLVAGIFRDSDDAPMEETTSWLVGHGIGMEPGRALVAQMTGAAASRCLQGNEDPGFMARAIARPGTYTAIGDEILVHRDALRSWSDACQSVLEAKRSRS